MAVYSMLSSISLGGAPRPASSSSSLSLSLCISLSLYIYIYVHTSLSLYLSLYLSIYIYIYIQYISIHNNYLFIISSIRISLYSSLFYMFSFFRGRGSSPASSSSSYLLLFSYTLFHFWLSNHFCYFLLTINLTFVSGAPRRASSSPASRPRRSRSSAGPSAAPPLRH